MIDHRRPDFLAVCFAITNRLRMRKAGPVANHLGVIRRVQLIETVAGDRRVKSVVLTDKGAKLRARLVRAFYKPPRILLEMPARDLEALRIASAKLSKPVRLEEKKA